MHLVGDWLARRVGIGGQRTAQRIAPGRAGREGPLIVFGAPPSPGFRRPQHDARDRPGGAGARPRFSVCPGLGCLARGSLLQLRYPHILHAGTSMPYSHARFAAGGCARVAAETKRRRVAAERVAHDRCSRKFDGSAAPPRTPVFAHRGTRGRAPSAGCPRTPLLLHILPVLSHVLGRVYRPPWQRRRRRRGGCCRS